MNVKEKCQNLINSINDITGEQDADLTSAIKSLVPTGNINITNTNQTDVSAYATAQVVDADLVAENIKKDVDILGVVGTFEGSGGGGGTSRKDVNFFDYDGTIVASYTKAEFLALSEMPENPTHEGLISQGWNWSFADAYDYVDSYGMLNVGQMYITDDNTTRVYVTLGEGRLNPAMRFTVNSGTATIDWGDGTEPITAISDAENTHTYAQAGDYVIKIDGNISITGTSSYSNLFKKPQNRSDENVVYANCIKRIELGRADIKSYAFIRCYSLQSVMIPNSVTRINDLEFSQCYSLRSVTIPNSVIELSNNVFYNCYGLQSVIIPNNLKSISNELFRGCYSLQSVMIPNSITELSQHTFYNCYGLQSVIIPEGVKNIWNYVFGYCNGLGFIKFTRQTPPTASNSNWYYQVPSDCKIYVPSGTLSAYTSATNYPPSSTYTYVEY